MHGHTNRSSQQSVLDRFTQACQADPRVVAGFVCGSLARGAADEHSDIDLGLITTDRSSDEFLEDYPKFIKVLGEPIFLELFGPSQTIFCILADGMEVEISIGREGDFVHMAYGPFRVLVDKQALLAGVTFLGRQPDPAEQRAHLRRQLTWFWHDVSHFLTAISRGQLWWAYGQIEALRGYCVSLIRLQHDFAVSDGGMEPYFKVEDALPASELALLAPTITPLEPERMMAAARVLVETYRNVAGPLAHAHGLPYPAALERLILDRLALLGADVEPLG